MAQLSSSLPHCGRLHALGQLNPGEEVVLSPDWREKRPRTRGTPTSRPGSDDSQRRHKRRSQTQALRLERDQKQTMELWLGSHKLASSVPEELRMMQVRGSSSFPPTQYERRGLGLWGWNILRVLPLYLPPITGPSPP